MSAPEIPRTTPWPPLDSDDPSPAGLAAAGTQSQAGKVARAGSRRSTTEAAERDREGCALRVGVDIGGTKTQAVVLDPEGRAVEQFRLPTGFGGQALLETAVQAVREVAARARISSDDFASIGVGIPGTVDSASGRVTHAVNLGIDDLDLAAELGNRLCTGVHVENDVNAAAFGAFQMVGTPAVGSLAYLNLGTGLAAGLVLNGELWRGSRGAAGEIGHIPVDPNGPQCSCGQRGCMEMMASGSAVLRQWPTTDPRPVQELFAAAHDGNALALDVKQSLVQNVASAVRALVLTVDVDVVVIGGGISSVGEPLLGDVREVLRARAAMSPFLASLDLDDRLRMVPSGFPAAAVGAALLGTAARVRSTGVRWTPVPP